MKKKTTLRDFLTELEGCSNTAYPSPEGGNDTIGIGRKLTDEEVKTGIIYIKGEAVEWRKGLTDQQVIDLYHQDTYIASLAINTLVEVQLTVGQLHALTSFVYNIGVGAFRKSTLLKKLNAEDFASIPSEMRKWVYITKNGKKIGPPDFCGLLSRREKEIKEWEST